MPDSNEDIRRILREISEIYAAAAREDTISEIRRALGPAHPRQYDVEFRIHRAFTTQGRDRARADSQ